METAVLATFLPYVQTAVLALVTVFYSLIAALVSLLAEVAAVVVEQSALAIALGQYLPLAGMYALKGALLTVLLAPL